MESMAARRSAEELRIYYCLRSDLMLTPDSLTAAVAHATARLRTSVLESGSLALLQAYAGARAKIALRVRDNLDLLKVYRSLTEGGVPVTIGHAGAVPVCLAAGPVCRGALPKLVQRLQLARDAWPESGIPLSMPAPDGQQLFLVERADITIPMGKLAAQYGHAVWEAMERAEQYGGDATEALADWREESCPVRRVILPGASDVHLAALDLAMRNIPSAVIVDAGRTVFAEPTVTVMGCGPCCEWDLPERLQAALPRPCRRVAP